MLGALGGTFLQPSNRAGDEKHGTRKAGQEHQDAPDGAEDLSRVQ